MKRHEGLYASYYQNNTFKLRRAYLSMKFVLSWAKQAAKIMSTQSESALKTTMRSRSSGMRHSQQWQVSRKMHSISTNSLITPIGLSEKVPQLLSSQFITGMIDINFMFLIILKNHSRLGVFAHSSKLCSSYRAIFLIFSLQE